LHLYLEASRLSYADRNAYIADPEFFDVMLEGLLSDGYAAERRALIVEMAGTSPAPPGNPRPYSSTTHLVVSDRKGTVVSYTFTIESTGGNGIVVPGYGFLLNNELTDFNIDSTTHPNRADGSKRPRSSMAPTIVTKDGEPYLAVGSPGGSTIITTVLQVLLERLDLGASLPEAIAAPRASQRNTAVTEAERAFIESTEGRTLASTYGHAFAEPTSEVIGAVTGIDFLDRGRILAAAEPERRGGGSAAVVRP
ncbi:MAG TPA: gamma-glutamyltransferase, partial [Thermoleophilaceae bacterium]|nr:gamma-glutamyltransferase [Thermoleophilaceae bacterium]